MTTQTTDFRCQDVSDCNSMMEVMERIMPADKEYRSVSIQDYIAERIRNAADFQLGSETAYALDDVIHSLTADFGDYRGVLSPFGDSFIVSDTYDLLQPYEALSIFEPVLSQYDYKFKRAGFLQGSRKMFIEATIGSFEVTGHREVGDVIEHRVTMYTGFDGSTQTDIADSLYRLWCSNGCGSWEKQWQVKCKHTVNQRDRLSSAVEHLCQSPSIFAALTAKLDRYAATALNRDQAKEAIKTILPSESTRTVNRRNEVLGQFNNVERGTFGHTVFDLFNAFTAYNSHEVTYRTTAVSREENRFVALNMGGADMRKIVKTLDAIAV